MCPYSQVVQKLVVQLPALNSLMDSLIAWCVLYMLYNTTLVLL